MSGRPSSYISTMTRLRAEAMSRRTSPKMDASCHSVTGSGRPDSEVRGAPPTPGACAICAAVVTGAAAGGTEHAVTQTASSRYASRAMARRRYRVNSRTPTWPVKAFVSSEQLYPHARSRPEHPVSACLSDPDFQVAHAPDVDEWLIGPGIRVGRRRGGDVVVVDSHRPHGRLQVRDQIAETVDPEHARNGVVEHLRLRGRMSQRLERHPSRKRRGGRGENVTSFKSGRRARVGRQLDRLLHSHLVDDDPEQPIVRTNVVATAGSNRQAPARAANPGIDHGQVYGSGPEMPGACEEHERAGKDVEPRNLVANVHESRVRAPGQDHRFHRRDQRGTRAKVGREGD